MGTTTCNSTDCDITKENTELIVKLKMPKIRGIGSILNWSIQENNMCTII